MNCLFFYLNAESNYYYLITAHKNMKKLVLIRHAKSSWKYPELSDEERPLNNRGHRDAPFMASKLKETNLSPDIIYSSPAIRAATTARYFAKAYGVNPNAIIYDKKVYEASESDLFDLIQTEFKDNWDTVFLFGHNFTFTFFANRFCQPSLDNIPTCGIVILPLKISSWKNFEYKTVENYSFEYPKKYFPKSD